MRAFALLLVAAAAAFAATTTAATTKPPCKPKTARRCVKHRPAPAPKPAPPAPLPIPAPTGPPCAFNADNKGLQGLTEGFTDPQLNLPATGDLRAVALFVDFSDAPASESIDTITSQMFTPAIAGYTEMSYGKLTLHVTEAPRWYRLPQPSSYYGLNSSDGAGRKDEYIAAAVRAADPDVDFSKYDLVYIVPSAGARADQATNTSRYAGSPLVTADGVGVRHAVLISEDRLTRWTHGVDQVLHETGHILGLPDLYVDQTAVAGWDLMSFSAMPSSTFNAWHRWKLGWLDPSQVRCVARGDTVDEPLTPLETTGGLKAIVAPIDASRFFVLEDRQQIGRDATLCDHGVVAYTVDASKPFDQQPVRIIPAHPGTDTDPGSLQRCAQIYDAPFDIGETTSYTDAADDVAFELLSRANGSYVVRVER